MNAVAIANHIETLRQLLAAQKSLDKIRERNSVIRPRTGIRGGLATTLEAKHSTAAQWRDKCYVRAEESSAALFGASSLNSEPNKEAAPESANSPRPVNHQSPER